MQFRTIFMPVALRKVFRESCKQYDRLDMATAWCGDPQKAPVFRYMRRGGLKLRATIGVSFYHTHPAAIRWLMRHRAAPRVFRSSGSLFHPKLYLFTSRKGYRLIIGSANLTAGGFGANTEACVIITGNELEAPPVRAAIDALARWRQDKCSFRVSAGWLTEYERGYSVALKKLQEMGQPSVRRPTTTAPERTRDAAASRRASSVAAALLKKGVHIDKPRRLVFDRREYVFTGRFETGTQAHCQSLTRKRGATIASSVTACTDVLVIGARGSPSYLWKKYGKKIKKADDLRKSSPRHLPAIIAEATWVAKL